MKFVLLNVSPNFQLNGTKNPALPRYSKTSTLSRTEMRAAISAQQDLDSSSAQRLMTWHGTTGSSMEDMVVESLARDNYYHDFINDCMVNACYESEGKSTSVSAHDDKPCGRQEQEALARPPR